MARAVLVFLVVLATAAPARGQARVDASPLQILHMVAYAVATGSEMPEFLEELTSLTGGRVVETGNSSDLTPIFRAILDEFRYRYLVTYSPTGVPKEGWHKLDVRVKRSGARVRARPGYQGRQTGDQEKL